MPLPSMFYGNTNQASTPRGGGWRGYHQASSLASTWAARALASNSAKQAEEAYHGVRLSQPWRPFVSINFNALQMRRTTLPNSRKCLPTCRQYFVEKGGWANPLGSEKPDTAVAHACAALLGNLK